MYPYPSVIEAVGKYFKKSPISANPTDNGWTLLATTPKYIHDRLASVDGFSVEKLSSTCELSPMGCLKKEYILLFDDASLKTYALYEGTKKGKLPTCTETSLRFCMKSSEDVN